jgi:hypothetical protein
MLKTNIRQSKPTTIVALWRRIHNLLSMMIELLLLLKEPIG